MAYVLRHLYNLYQTYLVDYSGKFYDFYYFGRSHIYFNPFIGLILDSRSDHLPLINSPITMLSICVGYLYIVLSLGPRFMEKRKPYQIKNILIVYNAFQIISNIAVGFYVS